MTTNDSSSLPRLGEALIATGLVTAEQIEAALIEQRETNEKLGRVLVRMGFVKRSEVDACLRKNVIAPTLIHELENLTEGSYGKLGSPSLCFKQLYRRRLITDNLLGDEENLNETVVVELHGAATIMVGGKESLPFAFRIDASNSMVSIDELDAGGLRLWITRLAKKIASGQDVAATDGNSSDVAIGLDEMAAALSELLRE